MNAQGVFQQVLEPARITLNGPNPWDIQVHQPAFYNRVLRGGSMALGESYMDNWWDVQRLDEFFNRVLTARLDRRVTLTPQTILAIARAHLRNDQTRRKAFEVGEKHYDRGNELFRAMLGETMAYTCGYWPTAQTLDQAQVEKLELVCRKLGLEPGMSVLDVGCGWGSFARYAAVKYGVRVVGISVSNEQIDYARQWCAGLDVQVEYRDYRDLGDLASQYDRIVSLGMFEHVGPKNYSTFMNVVRRNLRPDGLFLLHTIGGAADHRPDPWIQKYIFPNGIIPSLGQIIAASEPFFVNEDIHNFGTDYDRTLMAWHANFVHAWPGLAPRYDERFYRMWTYWLLSSAGSFRTRNSQLWQLVFSLPGVAGGYRSVR